MTGTRLPLLSCPADLVYFIFFIMHIPVSLLFDGQMVYPASLVPSALKSASGWYIHSTRDPLLAGVSGLSGGEPFVWVWFRSFLVLELVFQIPVFFVGAHGLWKDSRKIYPLLLIYGASSATTTLACVAIILASPTSPSLSSASGKVASALESASTFMLPPTTFQKLQLYSAYVPYLLVPLVLTIDMALRVGKLMGKGLAAEDKEGEAVEADRKVKMQ